MTWPSVRRVATAFRGGPVEVVLTPFGPGRAIRSTDPDVFCVVTDRPVAWCARCSAGEHAPPTPSSRGLNGKPEPLFAPGSGEHALFVLSWLSRFGRRHKGCGEPLPLDLGL